MNRLVAYYGNEPERVACALAPARAALVTRGDGAVQGWGLGFVQAGDILLQKRPRTESPEVDLFVLAKDLRADALVARIGLGDDGGAPTEDVDPYRFRSWLFASVGTAAGFEGIREKLLESVPDFLRRNVRGRSASEHVFHLFLAFLHDEGSLEPAAPTVDSVQRALSSSVAFLDRLLAGVGAPPSQLALVVSNGRCLVATARPHTLHYLPISGIPDCPVCRGRSSLDEDGRSVSHDELRAVVAEVMPGAPQPRPGWLTVPPGASLVVGSDRLAHVVGP